jgi:pimeloyl-ACP methyl ester carboxylesterase
MRPLRAGRPVRPVRPVREEAIEEGYRQFAGYRTRVLRVAGDGPPLLLLHGFSDSADTWRPVLRLLARTGRAAVAVDMPSHGHADGLHAGRPVIPQLADFAREAVRWCDSAGTVVAGNSLGGLVSLRLAEGPSAPAGVVGVCPAGLTYSRLLTTGATRLSRPALRRAVAVALGAAPVFLTDQVARAGVGRACADPRGLDPAFRLAYAGHVKSRSARRQLLGLLYGLREEVADGSPLRPERIACPVMLVWGEKDPLVPPSAARALLDVMPGLRSEVLLGVGHMPQLETPARLVELLNGFHPSDG